MLLLVAVCPLLLAPKRIEYDNLGVGVGPLGGDAGEVVAVAGVPCGEPGIARLRIREKRFNIECGCEEVDGKICTIPAGTTVFWKFSDSEEHNVKSKSGLFDESGDLLVGTFEESFNVPGQYVYSCSLHSISMSGYEIGVR